MKAFYFSHDYNARNDLKVLSIRAKFNNAEAYGMYWFIVESLHECGGQFKEADIPALAMSLSLNLERFTAFIFHCVECGLLKKDKKEFSCTRVIDNLNLRKSLSEARSQAGKLGGRPESKPKANEKQLLNKGKAKKSKGKERKGKEINTSETKVSDDDLQICKLLFTRIASWHPQYAKKSDAVVQTTITNWSEHIEKLHRIDEVTYDQMRSIIDWIYSASGSFWKPNILSASKFREQFTKLVAQALSPKN